MTHCLEAFPNESVERTNNLPVDWKWRAEPSWVRAYFMILKSLEPHDWISFLARRDEISDFRIWEFKVWNERDPTDSLQSRTSAIEEEAVCESIFLWKR